MTGNLRYDIFEDVILSPRTDRKPIYGGGLAKPLQYPKYCRHNRNGISIDSEIIIHDEHLSALSCKINNPYIFGGVYQWHFGHTIAEFVHRLWILEKEEFVDNTVVFIAPRGQTYAEEFFTQAMDYLQVKKWQIIDTSCLVNKLVIAEQGKTLNTISHKDYNAFLQRLAQKNKLFDPSSNKIFKKIAILRGHLKGRRYVCEQQLAEYLETQGYYIFYSDQHSLHSQLHVIANATDIIISDGSACHLFDLLPPIKAKVCFLARSPRIKLARYSLKPKVSAVHAFTDVISLVAPKSTTGQKLKTKALLYADLDKIIVFLKKHNFLNKDVPNIQSPPYRQDIIKYVTELDEHIIVVKSIDHIVTEFEKIRKARHSRFRNFSIHKKDITKQLLRIRSVFLNLVDLMRFR